MATNIDVTNAWDILTEFKGLVEADTDLAGTGGMIENTYDHQPDEDEVIQGSPLWWISLGGTERPPRATGSTVASEVTFLTEIMISLEAEGASKAEQRLCNYEKHFRDLISDEDTRFDNNNTPPLWTELEGGSFTPGYSEIGGKEYRIGIMQITFKKKDN